MPIQCPICSRINPEDAAYCYYDGRSLAQGAPEGPLEFGVLPFPMPFCFPDGHSCANFNQLALACDERWNEARGLLGEGIWKSFFTTLGRLDLATVAAQAAREPDVDVGFTQLLEKLPADADALRPPKLAVQLAEEDLGTLEPGKDRKFELQIANQGMFLLRGSVTTNCDWLFLGDRTGWQTSKLFQTRHAYSVTVRVLGDKLRAGQKPLEGQIVIESNGGSTTLPVRASVPIRPFPKGEYANDALAGAMSPRELAQKAKSHPKQAAVLFEQGAVKAWYASNGWNYPIQDTEVRGTAAVQQFFEALGLTKPPILEISSGPILCQGEVGQELTKNVTIRTKESRFVYAQASSNQDWIQAAPGESKGNAVTIPLHITVPPCPGTTLEAQVTIQGNGKQQFVVPVTLKVAAVSAPVETAIVPDDDVVVAALAPVPDVRVPVRPPLPVTWIFAGLGLLLFLVLAGVAALAVNGRRNQTVEPPVAELDPPVPPPPSSPPVPKAWWDSIPDSKLRSALAELKASAPAHLAIFDGIALASSLERYKWYEKLEAKLPELMDNAKASKPMGRFITACCVYEPDELTVSPLLRALARQFPREGVAFRPQEKGAELVELNRAFFWLQVECDAMTHKDRRPERARSMANDLASVFGVAPDAMLPLDKQPEKLLVQRCYRNMLPTAKSSSLEHAFTIRAFLIKKYPRYLDGIREEIDVDLIEIGLSRGNDKWAKLEPIAKMYLEKQDLASILVLRLLDKLGPERLQLEQLHELKARPDAEIQTLAKEILRILEDDLTYLCKRLSHKQPKEQELARAALLRFPSRWRKGEVPVDSTHLAVLTDVLNFANEKKDPALLRVAVDGLIRLLGSEPEEVVPLLVKIAQKKHDAKMTDEILLALVGLKKRNDEVLMLFADNLNESALGVCLSMSLALLEHAPERLDGRKSELVQRCRDGLKQDAPARKKWITVLTKLGNDGADALPELIPLLDPADEEMALLTVRAIKAIGCAKKAAPDLANFARFSRKSPAAMEALVLLSKAAPANAFFTKGKIVELVDAIRPDAAGLANCLANPLNNPSAQALLNLGAVAVEPLTELALKNNSPRDKKKPENQGEGPTSHRFMAYTLLAKLAEKAEGNGKLLAGLKGYELFLSDDVKTERELYERAGFTLEAKELYRRTHQAAVDAKAAISDLPSPKK